MTGPPASSLVLHVLGLFKGLLSSSILLEGGSASPAGEDALYAGCLPIRLAGAGVMIADSREETNTSAKIRVAFVRNFLITIQNPLLQI